MRRSPDAGARPSVSAWAGAAAAGGHRRRRRRGAAAVAAGGRGGRRWNRAPPRRRRTGAAAPAVGRAAPAPPSRRSAAGPDAPPRWPAPERPGRSSRGRSAPEPPGPPGPPAAGAAAVGGRQRPPRRRRSHRPPPPGPLGTARPAGPPGPPTAGAAAGRPAAGPGRRCRRLAARVAPRRAAASAPSAGSAGGVAGRGCAPAGVVAGEVEPGSVRDDDCDLDLALWRGPRGGLGLGWAPSAGSSVRMVREMRCRGMSTRQDLDLHDVAGLDDVVGVGDEVLGQRGDVHEAVLVDADVDERAERGDVGDDALQDHARLEVAEGVHAVGEGGGLELGPRVAAGLLQLLEDVVDGGEAERLVGELGRVEAAQRLGVADQRADVFVGLLQDAADDRVGLGVHAGGVERVVAAADPQEARALLERLGAEPGHVAQVLAGGERAASRRGARRSRRPGRR